MAHALAEVKWVKEILNSLGVKQQPIPMFHDNQVAIYIATNPIFH